LNQKLNQGL